jgi:hypothetical protein
MQTAGYVQTWDRLTRQHRLYLTHVPGATANRPPALAFIYIVKELLTDLVL